MAILATIKAIGRPFLAKHSALPSPEYVPLATHIPVPEPCHNQTDLLSTAGNDLAASVRLAKRRRENFVRSASVASPHPECELTQRRRCGLGCGTKESVKRRLRPPGRS